MLRTAVGTPLGPLELHWEPGTRRLLRLLLPGATGDAEPDVAPPPWAADAVGLLQRYFAGERVRFPESLVPWAAFSGFQGRVYRYVFGICWGAVDTYGQVAAACGAPRAARAVGNAMARNRYPIIVPCHRVVAAGGLGGFGGGLAMKRFLLRLEEGLGTPSAGSRTP